jgi:hypothetical protein
MNYQEYKDLMQIGRNPQTLAGEDLKDQTDRTLLYGYTIERDTHHVYLKDGVLHLFVYQHSSIHKHESGRLLLESLIPSKRLYPGKCDYEFCRFLKSQGLHLPFTAFALQSPVSQSPVSQSPVSQDVYFGRIY